jgi:hypothetical protein
VVILSLARHNYENKIGFLENRNRVCVALSRAKQGFYIFGSTEVLSQDEMWLSVIQQMRLSRRLVSKLILKCRAHGSRFEVMKTEDLSEGLGGCNEKCLEQLPCGHICQLKCHAFVHGVVQCGIMCSKPLLCGHACDALCFQECHCSCTTFQRSHLTRSTFSASDVRADDESSVEPRSVNTSELEPYIEGMYISGEAVPPKKSHPYLPYQASKSRSRSRSRAMSGEAGMNNQAMGTDHRGTTSLPVYQGTNMSSGRRHPSMSDHFNVYSEEEERTGRQNWKGFAEGGVIDDDIRRASFREVSSAEPSPEKRRRVTGNERHGLREQAQQLGNGRTRFVEAYRPAGLTASAEGVGHDALEKEMNSAENDDSIGEEDVKLVDEEVEAEEAKKGNVKLGVLIDFD